MLNLSSLTLLRVLSTTSVLLSTQAQSFLQTGSMLNLWSWSTPKQNDPRLCKELARQVHLAKVFKRFTSNAEKVSKWGAEKDAYLKTEESIHSVEDAEDAIDAVTLFEGEFKHMKSSALADLTRLGDELIAERFEKKGEVKATQERVNALFSTLEAGTAAKKSKLEAVLTAQKELNNRLYQAFADAINDFTSFIRGLRESLAGDAKHSLDEQLASATAAGARASEGEAKLAAIHAADAKLQERELANNPHTNVTYGDAQSMLEGFRALVGKKVELIREQIEDKKRGGLTPDQLKEIKDNFRYFDKDSNGFLTKKELRTCLQSLGEESTPKDIARVLTEYDKEHKGHLTYHNFEEFMKASLGDTDTQEEITKSFRYLSYDKDFILPIELSNVVNNRSFTEAHVKYLAASMHPKGEGLDYARWTGEVFAR